MVVMMEGGVFCVEYSALVLEWMDGCFPQIHMLEFVYLSWHALVNTVIIISIVAHRGVPHFVE